MWIHTCTLNINDLSRKNLINDLGNFQMKRKSFDDNHLDCRSLKKLTAAKGCCPIGLSQANQNRAQDIQENVLTLLPTIPKTTMKVVEYGNFLNQLTLTSPLGRLTLGFRVIAIDPCLVTCDYLVFPFRICSCHFQHVLTGCKPTQFLLISEESWDEFCRSPFELQFFGYDPSIDLEMPVSCSSSSKVVRGFSFIKSGVQDNFLRRLLNLPRYTPGFILRMECGRTSLGVTVLKLTLGFWLRILKMNSSRLPHICLAQLYEISRNRNIYIGLAESLASILNSTGFSWLINCNDARIIQQEIPLITKIAIEQSIQSDQAKIENSKFYSHYKYLHSSFRIENYLLSNFPFPVKRYITQQRILYSFFKENHTNIFKEGDKICDLCKENLETELSHYIYECQDISEERRTFFSMVDTSQLRLENGISRKQKSTFSTSAFLRISSRSIAAEAARDICNRHGKGVIGERAAQKWFA
ncbi:ARHGDIB [Cordylochernes scorpioides]|uniref:ARHGDIB n=1 Tax=Cordylochernes scorpioides TaxID=51811 RepID=A0ABY6LW08_9ARAC|nr:ARHGDIB [Cordylochernes scorpioides]